MPDRQRFVTRDESAKILDACPSCDWRAIVALARFGGLRCPSEVLSLRLEDVDWERERIRVTSPRTEHQPGKDSRMIALFPELRPILLDATFPCAPPKRMGQDSNLRWTRAHSGFQDRRLRPLGHPSGPCFYRVGSLLIIS